MLFNSYEFIFLFLPITLGCFYFLGRVSRKLALGWIVLASLVFYAWWRPINVLIIAPSILINYGLARWLLRLGADAGRARLAQAVLLIGVAFNIAFLGYFKYIEFLGNRSQRSGRHPIRLDPGDPAPWASRSSRSRRSPSSSMSTVGEFQIFSLREYGLFVLFFPQLIAGPIVHYREMMPQFDEIDLSLRLAGLRGRAVARCVRAREEGRVGRRHCRACLADLRHGGGGRACRLVQGWIAALGFTLQIYFDFSGYTDMALGLARFFGVRLPPTSTLR